MPPRTGRRLFSLSRALLHTVLTGPQVLAFLPAMVLAGFWIGGEGLLLVIALGVPLCLAIAGSFRSRSTTAPGKPAGANMPCVGDDLRARLDSQLETARAQGFRAVCIMVELDDSAALIAQHGQPATDQIMRLCFDRVTSAIRGQDRVFFLGKTRLAIAAAPVSSLNQLSTEQIAGRIQSAIEGPVSLDATKVYVSASVGFALDSHIHTRTGQALADAASLALDDALRHGPSALRAYSQDMKPLSPCPQTVCEELECALKEHQFEPWFQPQISTDTGQVTGLEALARWMHPVHGMISPAEFLPQLERAGKVDRLGRLMLSRTLEALVFWDAMQLHIPHVGVNFSPEELRDPKLVEKIQWELDRLSLPPDRLSVEILETVVATTSNDTAARNISGLSALGCVIDLDDFGTGNASTSTIRRFAIQRLKIDRSFVTKVDQDPDQQRLVSAILLMAERLGLATVAEGVETAGEHAMLAQLGCDHVQGFGIARPMPASEVPGWIQQHNAKLSDPPQIGRKTG